MQTGRSASLCNQPRFLVKHPATQSVATGIPTQPFDRLRNRVGTSNHEYHP